MNYSCNCLLLLQIIVNTTEGLVGRDVGSELNIVAGPGMIRVIINSNWCKKMILQKGYKCNPCTQKLSTVSTLKIKYQSHLVIKKELLVVIPSMTLQFERICAEK